MTTVVVALGVIGGTAANVLMTRYQFHGIPGHHTGYVIVLGIASIVGITGVLWILLPKALFDRIPYFGVYFVWIFALVSVTREVISPRVGETFGQT
jgi:hypothetical protein